MSSAQLTVGPRTYGWRSWRDPLREVLLGVAIGVGITLIESGGTDQFPPTSTFIRNAIIGAAVMAVSRGLETMLSWAIEQSNIANVFRAILYAIGGWAGYFLGMIASGMIFGIEHDDLDPASYHFSYSLSAAALGAVLIGLILHHNRKRNDRLRAAIERLKEHEFAEKELEIARAMQQRLLPPQLIEHNGFRITAQTHAAHMVGGDFYDVVRLADGGMAILVADVSGKGIVASLIMASCKAMIPFLAVSGGAAEIAGAINESLCSSLERRQFVAMVVARYDRASGTLDIVNAGMPDPLLIDKGSVTTLGFAGERLPLGAKRGVRYDSTRIDLQRGQRLVFFSDGLPEASAGDGPLGYEKTEMLARDAATVDELLNALKSMADLRVEDDITVLMLERT